MGSSPFFYSQEIVQVRTDTWSTGRVVLAGDAAHCASPYSGMGISGGLVGAHEAFYRYSQVTRPDQLEDPMNRSCSLPQVRPDLPTDDRKNRPDMLRVTDRYDYSIHFRVNDLTDGCAECDHQACVRAVITAPGAGAFPSRRVAS